MQLQKQLRSDAPRAPVSRVRVANARLFGFFSAPYTQQRFVCWGLGHRHPHQVQIFEVHRMACGYTRRTRQKRRQLGFK